MLLVLRLCLCQSVLSHASFLCFTFCFTIVTKIGFRKEQRENKEMQLSQRIDICINRNLLYSISQNTMSDCMDGIVIEKSGILKTMKEQWSIPITGSHCCYAKA